MTPSFTMNHAPVASAVKSVSRRHSRGSVAAGWVDSWPGVSAGTDVGDAIGAASSMSSDVGDDGAVDGVDGSAMALPEAAVSVMATSAAIAVARRTRRFIRIERRTLASARTWKPQTG
jgi:hypothetical protein